MKRQYNIHEAKTHFSKLLEQVAKGKEVTIARAGQVIAKLIPFKESPRTRKPGTAAGLIEIGEDFDAPLPQDILKTFLENTNSPIADCASDSRKVSAAHPR